MMRSMKHTLIALCLMLLVACASSEPKSEPAAAPAPASAEAPKPDFRSSMQRLSQTLTELLPKTIAEHGMESNTDRESVRRNVDELSKLVHTIDGRTAVPSQDPSLRMVSREFSTELAEVKTMIDQNRWAAAKTRLNHITQYCIACHTMGPAASSEYTLNFYPDVPNLSHFERAKYKTAIRQFESAIKEYETALNDKEWAKSHPEDWENGLLSVLTLVTHVRKDANLALEMISSFRDRGSMPAYLTSASLIWRQQAKAWDREKKASASLANVEEWIAMATKMKSPKYANTFLWVRSSARLHEMLAQGELKGADEARALYNQGVVGVELKKINYFVMPEQSFKLCADKAGATPLARKCEQALKEFQSRSKDL